MKKIIYVALFFSVIVANAQESITYQKPPQEILDLVDVKRAPSVLMDDKNENMI